MQMLKKVFPNSVIKGSDGFLSIIKDEMFYAMLNAIKEFDVRITKIVNDILALDKKVKMLEKRNQELEKKNKELENRIKLIEQKLSKI